MRLADSLKKGASSVLWIALPILAAVVGIKLLAPWVCQFLNGGTPCPAYSPKIMAPPTMPGGGKPGAMT